jgi:hypothetical protein
VPGAQLPMPDAARSLGEAPLAEGEVFPWHELFVVLGAHAACQSRRARPMLGPLGRRYSDRSVRYRRERWPTNRCRQLLVRRYLLRSRR